MSVTGLSAHPRAMDEPLPSEVVTNPNSSIGYRWIVTDAECAHIADMLHVDSDFEAHALNPIYTQPTQHCRALTCLLTSLQDHDPRQCHGTATVRLHWLR
ncbi:hypothetical protein N657DRAFT_640417 [Parathielavia appendiculata]|uniref:Uncharacterized protein n=1 Tax=Parathielavia appendiculata TaxID=2587402 RepID=A0AAN6UB38_9PEZI|nr:hypothetical protein N657DRAFT_640417 [Parathielavia appendiculata]